MSGLVVFTSFLNLVSVHLKGHNILKQILEERIRGTPVIIFNV